MIAKAEEPADLPERIGQRYRVLRALGRGGMASVYEAIDEVTGKRLAVKQLDPERAATDSHLVRLFELEFHTLTQLAHPRVVEVYDYHNLGDGPCYSMELLDGGDLREQSALPWREICALLCDVCSALSLLHSRRFVHRDVTPRNIRRTPDGKAKLIDFGAMVPFGAHKHLVGTPAFTSPEAAIGQALDGRADLFSLGATAYYALTGRHAYPGRSFAGMRNIWRTQPAVPSRYVPDIPPALDQLVMSLLSLSAARRPASAAAVIERLTAIAGLQVEEQLLVQRSFLSTPSLVGRDLTLQQIRRQMIHAARGRGASLFLTGPRGVGRSRIVDACVLEGKLASATVLCADAADAEDGDWGGVRSLLDQLLSELPTTAVQLITPTAGDLAHVWPRATELTGVAARDWAPRHASLRAAVHSALLRLMDAITRQGLLVVTADDLERVDEPTRAFITLLAQQVRGRRMVVVTAASSESVASGIPGLELLRQAESTIVLAPLSLAETEKLLTSMFGDVPNLSLLAHHLHEVANGSPASIMQLCQHLLDRDIVGFRDGAWLLPSVIDRRALPSSVTDALHARIAQLDATSRELGQAIALSAERALTLDQCRQLVAESDRPQLLHCLDALTAAEIVRASGDRYALSQPVWSQLLCSNLNPELARSLHARIAEMLCQRADSDLRAAGHLLACGQSLKGIELLLGCLDAYSKQLAEDPARLPEHLQALPSNWMQTLELAVNEAVRLGLPRRTQLQLQLRWLERLTITTQPRCDVARQVVQQLYADSGLRDCVELRDSVAPEQLLGEAFKRTQARYEATPEAERGLPLGEAIPMIARVYAQLIGMVGAAQDHELLLSLPSLAPFVALSPAIRLVKLNVESTCHIFAGRVEQAFAGYLEILASMNAQSGGMAPTLQRYMTLAITYAIAVTETMYGRASCAERIDLLERDPLFEVNALRLRKAWALRQGDTESADGFVRKYEMLRIRNAPRQFFEGSEGWYEAVAFAEIGDVARLRSILDKLDTMAARFYKWQAAPLFARGHIQLLRGDTTGAIEAFGAALTKAAAGEVQCWAANARGFLEALAEAGRVQEARAHGATMLQQAYDARLTVLCVLVLFAMASVELAGGDHAAALARLAEVDAIREHWPIGAVFAGKCFELRARVAIAMHALSAFEAAASECEARFSSSKNSILNGRYQRLLQDAERAGLRASSANTRAPSEEDSPTIATRNRSKPDADTIDLSRCPDPESRVRSALSLVAEHAAVRHIMLFLMRDGQPKLVGATERCPMAAGVETLVEQFLVDELEVSRADAIDPEDVMTTTVDNEAWTGPTGVRFVPALLSHTMREQLVVTGVLVFDIDGHAHPSDALLTALSAALTAASDVVPLVVKNALSA